MIEKMARVLEPQAWAALGSRDTLAYRNRRTSSLRKAKAALQVLREPGEGAVEAMMLNICAIEENDSYAEKGDAAKSAFTAAIDHFLAEGERT